ncbi:hypothetical protein HPB52_005847 [Rhipicephalus sanguineus]|uniref:Bromo domain-containing protein n=1 Tax=Rhipicephalus sanguineus TaxID=34632 RepID=A0A9D4PYI9_RHISA|nr:hypothetical protein HPB52_005847 [Rhipicephalus sanguineus]
MLPTMQQAHRPRAKLCRHCNCPWGGGCHLKAPHSGQYRDITEFHEDMMLVKRNCQTYNPPDHEASQDCEEVFAFYLQEYNRLVEKWQKSHLLSSPKRSKLS